MITIDPEEQAEAIKSSPMEDIVRVWQAPRDGMVSISGTVSLIAPEGDYDKEEYAKETVCVYQSRKVKPKDGT